MIALPPQPHGFEGFFGVAERLVSNEFPVSAHRVDEGEWNLRFKSSRAAPSVHLSEGNNLVARLKQLVSLEAQPVKALVQLLKRLPDAVWAPIRHSAHVASICNPLDVWSKPGHPRRSAAKLTGAPFLPCTPVARSGSTRPTFAAGWKAKPNEACSGSS
jgi:hypothetical protein